ncbi:hypothetical protein [Persephonella sp.]
MAENTRVREEIIKFLLNPHNKDNYLGYEILKRVFASQYSRFPLVKERYELEEIYNEFLHKVIFKEKGFLLNNTILEKIHDEYTNIISYLYTTINNFLRTINKQILSEIKTEKGEDRYKNLFIKDEEKKERETIHLKTEVAYIIIIEAKEILEKIKEDFDEKDLRTLCYMFLDDKTFFEEKITDDNAYQRKSRLKKKLTKYVKENGFSKEGFLYFVQNYLSEICKNFR